MKMYFGPKRGTVFHFFTISGYFPDPQSAAQAALSIFRIVWDLPPNEWLWVTADQYDFRDEPKRPPVWPPAGA